MNKSKPKYELHQMTETRPYKIWTCMLQRCCNPKATSYKNYGGRGITVSERWRYSFVNFWEDMKNGYAENLTLDRIDENKSYCKENCQWLSRKDNVLKGSSMGAVNKRKTLCKRGHELTETGENKRKCFTCEKEYQKEYRKLSKYKEYQREYQKTYAR